MRASRYVSAFLILAVALPVFGQGSSAQTTRDSKGVWFIEGGSLYDVYEAMGYAVATDRLFQMDQYRRTANGRLSELLGPSQIETDIGLRLFSYSDAELAAQFAALSADGQTIVQAYVDGINRRIDEFYAGNWMLMPHEYWVLSFESVFKLGGGAVLPTYWTVNDVLHWMVTLSRFFDPEGDFASNNLGQLDNYTLMQTLAAVYPQEYLAMFSDLRWINDPEALTYIHPAAATAAEAQYPADPRPPERDPPRPQRRRRPAPRPRRPAQPQPGEHQLQRRGWAATPGWCRGTRPPRATRSSTRVRRWASRTPSIVVEGSIRGGGLEVSGMTVPGVPGIIIGRTPHHAWSMQVGHAHTVDFYLEAPQSVSLHRMETIKVRRRQRRDHPHLPQPARSDHRARSPTTPTTRPARSSPGRTPTGGARCRRWTPSSSSRAPRASPSSTPASRQIAVSQHFTLRRPRRQHRLLDVGLRPGPGGRRRSALPVRRRRHHGVDRCAPAARPRRQPRRGVLRRLEQQGLRRLHQRDQQLRLLLRPRPPRPRHRRVPRRPTTT